MAAKGEREEFFGPTRWSIVQSASGPHTDPARKQALETLIELYRAPIARCLDAKLYRLSMRTDTSDRMTLSFFAYLITEEVLRKANRERGTFRSFLQGVMQNWVLYQGRDGLRNHEDIERFEHLAARDEQPSVARAHQEFVTFTLDKSLRRLHDDDPRGHEVLVCTEGLLGHAKESSDEIATRLRITTTNLDQKKMVAKRRLRVIIEQMIRDRASSASDARDEFEQHLRWLTETYPSLVDANALEAGGD